jgi:hypothetical protein
VIERGTYEVKDAVSAQPWLPDGPIPFDVTWSRPRAAAADVAPTATDRPGVDHAPGVAGATGAGPDHVGVAPGNGAAPAHDEADGDGHGPADREDLSLGE